MTEQTDNVKNVLDIVAVFTTLGTFLNLLTPVFGLILQACMPIFIQWQKEWAMAFLLEAF